MASSAGENVARPRFEFSRRIRWSEVDALGQVHFANYPRLMEEAEYAFLRSRGLSVVLQDERGTIGFPRVSTEFKVLQPARRNERVFVSLELMDANFKQLEYSFEIVNEDAELIAVGRFLAACCRFPDDKPPYAILTPDFILDALRQ